MLRDFTWAEKYEEAMSDENPHNAYLTLYPKMWSSQQTHLKLES